MNNGGAGLGETGPSRISLFPIAASQDDTTALALVNGAKGTYSPQCVCACARLVHGLKVPIIIIVPSTLLLRVPNQCVCAWRRPVLVYTLATPSQTGFSELADERIGRTAIDYILTVAKSDKKRKDIGVCRLS